MNGTFTSTSPSSQPPHSSPSASSWPSAFYPYLPLQHYHEPALTSLAYRPLQHVPLQQPDLLSPLQQQYLQHQQRLSLVHPSSAPQQQSVLSSTFPARPFPFRNRRRTRHALAMASFQPTAGTTEEELAELQKLSNEYEPEVTGPLVGQLQPSTAITTEYASADPVFQAKTAALPQKYSHYRTVRGDGRCGWRAIAFGYFETLIHYGDANRFLEEETRLRSSSNVLNMAGFDPMLYEDFADETFDLLRKVAQATQAGNAEAVLLEAFNDDTLQNFIMTHLKTLTAAWMKTRPQEYAPWLLGQTVDEYCNASVMPIGAEIDNVGLSALKDAFLSPAGITLEVLYLDRSEGNEVNLHRFCPPNHGGFDIGTIRLLYRPGHYDLLYKLQAPPQLVVPAAVSAHLQYHYPSEPASELGVADFMSLIPGMSYASAHDGWASYNSYANMDCFNNGASVDRCTPSVPVPSAPAPQPHMRHSSYLSPTSARPASPPLQLAQDVTLHGIQGETLSPHAGFPHQIGPFRPSRYELTPEFGQATSQTPLQTAIFRNSHFNTAHFMNENFQPEAWHPDDEGGTSSSSGSKISRNRNSG